jgi:hypothetical protein
MNKQPDSPVTTQEFDKAIAKFKADVAYHFDKFEQHMDERFDKAEAKIDAHLNRQDVTIENLAVRYSPIL